MPKVDLEAVASWTAWWSKWHRRVTCLTGARRRGRPGRPFRRRVRSTDVHAAWLRFYWPALDPHYVVPAEWLALSPEEKQRVPRPTLRLEPRRVTPARERPPGWSMDDVGPYLKLPDGTVLRDRALAAHRLWREERDNPSVHAVIELLPRRVGDGGRPVRARMAGRLLDALVAYGLVAAGMTRLAAAAKVLEWAGTPDRDPKKVADGNTAIWRELRLPAVGA